MRGTGICIIIKNPDTSCPASSMTHTPSKTPQNRPLRSAPARANEPLSPDLPTPLPPCTQISHCIVSLSSPSLVQVHHSPPRNPPDRALANCSPLANYESSPPHTVLLAPCPPFHLQYVHVRTSVQLPPVLRSHCPFLPPRSALGTRQAVEAAPGPCTCLLSRPLQASEGLGGR